MTILRMIAWLVFTFAALIGLFAWIATAVGGRAEARQRRIMDKNNK